VTVAAPAAPAPDAPRRHLGVGQATILALGMIMSTDTLKTAPTIALNVGAWHFYGLWVLGGLLSMVGAMCYVEMATTFPDPGGDYAFLRRAYGREVGLLFAWSRFSIMHTGWIALMAFLLADYAGALLPLGHAGKILVALATVASLVGLNLLHVRFGFLTQAGLVGLVAAGFLSVVVAGVVVLLGGHAPAPVQATAQGASPSMAKISVALIYIFLAYGGWSDAATLSAEVRSDKRGMLITIIGSVVVLMAIYLALNWAMLAGLGAQALAHSTAPAADLLGLAFGRAGQGLIFIVVALSTIASINSTLIVGARTTYAAARDVPLLTALGRWDGTRGVPARAVLAEGAVAMALIGVGSFAASGFNAMVNYMTPVYWFFIALSIGAMMILRHRFPDAPRPVRTPLYPLFPVSFLAIAVYMFASSLADLGEEAKFGAWVMGAGLVIVLALRWATPRAEAVALAVKD
jgi:amino acid transporter